MHIINLQLVQKTVSFLVVYVISPYPFFYFEDVF